MKSIDKINKQLVLRGLTGAELCREIGLSNSVYSLWNTGKNNPSNKTIAKIADFLHVDIEELLDDEIIEAMKEPESAKEKQPAQKGKLSDRLEKIMEYAERLTEEQQDFLITLLSSFQHNQ